MSECSRYVIVCSVPRPICKSGDLGAADSICNNLRFSIVFVSPVCGVVWVGARFLIISVLIRHQISEVGPRFSQS